MAKTTKLTEEEIKTLSEIEKKFGLIKEEFGNIYIQKLNLKNRKARAENFYA